jgi:hypothetical protein
VTAGLPFLTPACSSGSILSTNTQSAAVGFLVKLARHSEARPTVETGQRLASEFEVASSGVLAQAGGNCRARQERARAMHARI